MRKICVNSHWYYRKWWHKYLKIKHVSHDCFQMEWRDTPIRRFNKWVAPPANKGGTMTPKEIQELLPDGYGGDFEMTCMQNYEGEEEE